MIRAAYLIVYAGIAALAEALVARPAMLWLRSQGLFRPAVAWGVPMGAVALALAVLVAALAFWLAANAGLGRKPRTPEHAALLGLLALCFVLRRAGGDPRPPADSVAPLLEAMRATADQLDRSWSAGYSTDPAPLDAVLAHLPDPGFRLHGRSLPLQARILAGAEGPQLNPLEDDQPGTIYVAMSKDRQAAWITALSLDGVLKLASGKPAAIEAHTGSHSLPGRDPLVPAYPGMRSVTR